MLSHDKQIDANKSTQHAAMRAAKNVKHIGGSTKLSTCLIFESDSKHIYRMIM